MEPAAVYFDRLIKNRLLFAVIALPTLTGDFLLSDFDKEAGRSLFTNRNYPRLLQQTTIVEWFTEVSFFQFRKIAGHLATSGLEWQNIIIG